jgi:alpha-N-arabinofuranosidase
MNFFRSALILLLLFAGNLSAQSADNRIIASPELTKHMISRHIYGHFSEHLGRCIYGGFFVEENSSIANTRRIRTDIVDALRKIKIPNLRWPGGCFADEYHWNDGIGERSNRPKMINTHWGGVV